MPWVDAQTSFRRVVVAVPILETEANHVVLQIPISENACSWYRKYIGNMLGTTDKLRHYENSLPHLKTEWTLF